MVQSNARLFLLFDMGLAESREKAKTLIMMGQVYVDNQKSDKPGTPVSEDAKIAAARRRIARAYVGRG
ncbi:MAG: S4 domain-containing protein [Eubacteriales bacterium]